MGTLSKGISRTLSVTLTESLAVDVEAMAHEENLSIDELFQRAFLAYKCAKMNARLDAIRATVPATQYTEDDVVDLVKAVRRELSHSPKE